MLNPATGGHRTIRVITQKEDAKFAPGRRIVQLLTGSDNTKSYTGFGFIENDGQISVWHKKRGPDILRIADMVTNPEKYQNRGIVYNFEGHCRICNRLLTTPESVALGIGPTCAKGLKNGRLESR